MTGPSPVSVYYSSVRRSPFSRSVAIIVTAAAVGPPVGGIVVLLLTVATVNVHPDTILAEILQFGLQFGEYLIQSYVLGLLPAICFGILFCIAAFGVPLEFLMGGSRGLVASKHGLASDDWSRHGK